MTRLGWRGVRTSVALSASCGPPTPRPCPLLSPLPLPGSSLLPLPQTLNRRLRLWLSPQSSGLWEIIYCREVKTSGSFTPIGRSCASRAQGAIFSENPGWLFFPKPSLSLSLFLSNFFLGLSLTLSWIANHKLFKDSAVS